MDSLAYVWYSTGVGKRQWKEEGMEATTKNVCSCLDLEKSQRDYHNHNGYPCLRFRNGCACSAEKIDDQKWIPIVDGEEVGTKCYRTRSEAIDRAMKRAAKRQPEG